MDYFIAPGAVVLGDVRLGDNASVWYNAVVRADQQTITIGDNSNVQDNCTIHVESGLDVNIGNNVTIGHNAIIHGCTIKDNTLIGMGAIVMNRAVIGKNCIIGAGTLVPENAEIPDNSLVVGVPGRVRREVSEKEAAQITENALVYVKEAQEYRGN